MSDTLSQVKEIIDLAEQIDVEVDASSVLESDWERFKVTSFGKFVYELTKYDIAEELLDTEIGHYIADCERIRIVSDGYDRLDKDLSRLKESMGGI